ncbi:hypothetical protein [Pelagicoccus sp. SDUM812005]|uniref:hypothetical protein n=1 Tax=Pelagicoccus sp. SDUM812005 TaxID=3041257 RepID=UPI00280ECD5E|nr:hypothetical protein [Pelagicoccus sp. SDUM812005]MDQ8179647.1 hypothetical protein [Pelagicoccus sp. SDUM812005]
MLKIAIVSCLISFTTLAHAGDAFKLLQSDKHAAAIIAYLESVDIAGVEASPFVEYQRSEELVAALARYAALMEETIYQGREELYQAGKGSAVGFAALLDAKIRHQMAMGAVQTLKPEHFLAEVSGSEASAPVKPLLAGVAAATE